MAYLCRDVTGEEVVLIDVQTAAAGRDVVRCMVRVLYLQRLTSSPWPEVIVHDAEVQQLSGIEPLSGKIVDLDQLLRLNRSRRSKL